MPCSRNQIQSIDRTNNRQPLQLHINTLIFKSMLSELNIDGAYMAYMAAKWLYKTFIAFMWWITSSFAANFPIYFMDLYSPKYDKVDHIAIDIHASEVIHVWGVGHVKAMIHVVYMHISVDIVLCSVQLYIPYVLKLMNGVHEIGVHWIECKYYK